MIVHPLQAESQSLAPSSCFLFTFFRPRLLIVAHHIHTTHIAIPLRECLCQHLLLTKIAEMHILAVILEKSPFLGLVAALDDASLETELLLESGKA
jgi:hypothetical protein